MSALWLLQQLLIAPDGPSTPFGSDTLIVVDSLRSIVIFLGIIVFIVTPFAMAKARLPGQQVRLFVMALFTFAAFGTEIEHFGDYASWRLIVNTIATAGATWGQWSFFKYELPTQIKLQPDPFHLRAELPPNSDDVKATDGEA